ncbi:YheT family hydrolase [Maridesulfovibrio bastinii]|uniref:YheT family hydrolase n=1 Tax=Maridesulfovibrio bastinii TaxID=47157 RepID=UPI000419F0E9|nr:alpha/beta fold hydrolase [Maridesulfovibrio bastinii]
MPLLQTPAYKPPLPFKIGHFQTIFPRFFRKIPLPPIVKRRITTPDGDFLDVDWHLAGSSRLAVISHGLEGNSRRVYMLGMARALVLAGWDCIAYNFRGCSEEMNRAATMYHSGLTSDLDTVVKYGLETGHYKEVALVGFSMGGNQTLKYLGENPESIPQQIKRAVCISVPCNLAASSAMLIKNSNRIYTKYFLHSLKQKIRLKHEQFPTLYPVKNLDRIKTLTEFDNTYTAPIHGFKDAMDYYDRSSCTQFLSNIKTPTLILNSKDDPFLDDSCYPTSEAIANSNVFLQIPLYGGHVGFAQWPMETQFWSEKRAIRFLNT